MKSNAICLECLQFSEGIFSVLPGEERKESLCIMNAAVYEKKQPVFVEGENNNLVYLICSGLIKVFKNTFQKKVQILDVAGPGEILGLESLFSSRCESSAESLTRSKVCYCHRKRFSEFLDKKPSVSKRLIEAMQKNLTRTQRLLCNLGTKKALSRVASCILFFKEKQDPDPNQRTFYLPIMRSEMSELLGLSAETISRQLKKLEQDKLIKVANRRITILNPQSLNMLAWKS